MNGENEMNVLNEDGEKKETISTERRGGLYNLGHGDERAPFQTRNLVQHSNVTESNTVRTWKGES